MGAGVGLAIVGVLGSLPFTERGSAWLLQGAQAVLPGLTVQAPSGALLRNFGVERLVWQLNAQQRLVIDNARWTGLRLTHQPAWGLHLQGLQAQRVAIEGRAPAKTGPSPLPTQLSLPVGLFVDQVRIARVDAPALGEAPLRDLRFELRLPAGQQVRHELRGLSLQWERLQAQGSFSIGANAPLLLKAQLKLRNDGDAALNRPVLAEDWQAHLQAQGALARFRVQGRLRARGQSVDAEALVRPDHAMPLESAEARMAGFDLAGLSQRWPHTALAGLAKVQLSQPTPPPAAPTVQIEADLRNDAADRTDRQALPARALQLQATTAIDNLSQGELQQLVLELGSRQRGAGRLQGSGSWRTEGRAGDRVLALHLEARLQSLQPAGLDARAPAIELSGPAQLDWRQPWPEAGTTATQPLGTGHLRADWTGRQLQPAHPGDNPAVRLQLDADGTPQQLTLRRLEATAGRSQWLAQGQARRDTDAWALQLQSTLRSFDPGLWLGPSRLPASRIDATIDTQLRWLDATAAASAWQQRLRGQASVQLQPSVLAGVPGQGSLQLRSQQALLADGQLHLGNPTTGDHPVDITLQGRLDAQGSRDHWQLHWTGRQLTALSPWLQGAASHAELSGLSEGNLTLDGRWPRLTGQGQATIAQLRWRQVADRTIAAVTPRATTSVAQDAQRAAQQVLSAAQRAAGADAASRQTAAAPGSTVTLRDVQAQWQFGSQPDDPFALSLRLAQAQAPGAQLLATALVGEGRMGQHTWRAQGTVMPLGNRATDRAGASAALSQTTTTTTTTTTTATGTNTGTSITTLSGSAVPWSWQLAASGGWLLGEASAAAPAQRAAVTRTAWGWQGQWQQLHAQRLRPPGNPAAAAASVQVQLDPASFSLLQDDAGTHLAVGRTQLRLNQAALSIDTLRWDRTAAGSSLDLVSQLPPTALAPLLALAQPDFGWRGDLQVAGQVTVHARPGSMQALAELHRDRGDLAVEAFDLGTQPQPLGLTALSVKLQAQDGRWTFNEHVAGARMGRLQGDFSARAEAGDWWPGPSAALNGRVDLAVSQLGFWGAWLPTGWRLGGQLDAHADVTGTMGTPRLDGQVQGQHIAVHNVLQGVDWRDATLRARLSGEAIELQQLTLQAGAGTLSATGQVTLGNNPTIRLAARAARFAALQRIDRRVVLSGQADLLVDASRLQLNGQLQADEGRIDFSRSDAPSLSSDVEVLRPSEGDSVVQAQAKAPQRQLQLDLRASLGSQFHLVGRGLDTRLTGELRLTSPNSKPQLAGTIRAEDGTYAAYGQKLAIERGLITFYGPIDNPRLDVQAVRPDLDNVKVGVAITGTAQSPRVRLFSDPDMTDTDKLSWLLMGRASDGLGRTDLALLQRAAYALLSGENDSPSLIQRLGIDSLSVSQTDGTVQETVVSLGKQLSRRWYLGYERSLQATAGTWLLTYKLAQRFTVRAQSGAENALDVIWSWKWGLNE